MNDIKTITVLGANGTMGQNVAGIFASFGGCKVYAVSRNIVDAQNAVESAAQSVRAASVKKNLVAQDWSSIATCIAESDLVFDSTSENMEVKREVLQRIDPYLTDDAIVCAGTSGLSIDALSTSLSGVHAQRFFGMHLFNPPYVMKLCELIPNKFARGCSLESELQQWIENTLGGKVVITSDSPAFLANRVGFQLINSAMQLAELHADRGGLDYVDALIGPFTGRAMRPLATADFVGLDVHKAIVDNVYVNAADDSARDSFVLPKYVQNLIDDGHLGRKSGQAGGLFGRVSTEYGGFQNLVYDISDASYRAKRSYEFGFAANMVAALHVGDYKAASEAMRNDRSEDAQICRSMLANYILYALHTSSAVSEGPRSVDVAMATGFNWCPPLAMLDMLSLSGNAQEFVEENATLANVALDKSLFEQFKGERVSSFDYRKFFKAAL